MFFKRKIDQVLRNWKKDPHHLPLIVKGARQVGKTASIRYFGQLQYKYYIEINFILQKQYRGIFDDGFEEFLWGKGYTEAQVEVKAARWGHYFSK